MDDDFPVTWFPVKDEFDYTPTNTTVKVRVYKFLLGTHGPFVERVPVTQVTDDTARELVERYRRTLRSLPA